MNIHRVTLVFDDKLRPDTVGVYCRCALAELVEVVHFHPDQRDQIPSIGFDLYLSIDDDTDHRLPPSLRPLAYWAIDTHLDFDARVERSRRCDVVFAAQRDGAERLRAAGIDSATWLPLACDPEIHGKIDVPKQYDVSFVGRFCPGPRDQLLNLLRRNFADHFIGQAYFEEMARTYAASRTVFNRSIRNDVNMRVFEALACGSLLITNDLTDNGQEELFQNGVHLATYCDADELLEKVTHYLAHEEQREAIAATGRAEALARHTYRHRMERLLAETEAQLARRVIPGAEFTLDRKNGNRERNGRGPATAPNAPHATFVPGLTTIIVPCWNQLEFTKLCVRSLFRHTATPWELVMVNNGSSDGTRDFLDGLNAGGRVPVSLVTNARNLGYPAAINQGLRFARGEYLVLLNNDVVVTEGWLEHLIALTAARTSQDEMQPAAEASLDGEQTGTTARGIGLVGPMSNYAAPPQLVEAVPYHDLDEMPAFARRWRDEHAGKWFTVPKLSGFCLLMKRAVYEKIGGLDERFGVGFFDDDDLAERARRAGFELAVAHDLFVHHFGSRTFVGNGVDAERMLDENAAKFAAKWGNTVPRGERVTLQPFSSHPQTGVVAPKADSAGGNEGNGQAGRGTERARVSLTMIVRDEEKNLSACLGSVNGLFDEIVIVDTGSRDRTIEIARSFGARVFDFVWVDDFAAARNAALARATGDYAFWLDADDLIEPLERKKLEGLLGRLRGAQPACQDGDRHRHPWPEPVPFCGQSPLASAYAVRCKCDPSPDGTGGDTVVDHIRLFPLIEGVRWTYRVHEQILPAKRWSTGSAVSRAKPNRVCDGSWGCAGRSVT